MIILDQFEYFLHLIIFYGYLFEPPRRNSSNRIERPAQMRVRDMVVIIANGKIGSKLERRMKNLYYFDTKLKSLVNLLKVISISKMLLLSPQ